MGGERSARCYDAPPGGNPGDYGVPSSYDVRDAVTCTQAEHDILQIQNGSLASESLKHCRGFVKIAPNKVVNERTGLEFQFSIHGLVHLKNTQYPRLPKLSGSLLNV